MRHIMPNSSNQASDIERGQVKLMGVRHSLEAGHMNAPFAIRTTPGQKTCPKGPSTNVASRLTGFRDPCRTTNTLATATMFHELPADVDQLRSFEISDTFLL